MSIAAIAWIILAIVVALAILISIVLMIPELRRYFHIRHM